MSHAARHPARTAHRWAGLLCALLWLAWLPIVSGAVVLPAGKTLVSTSKQFVVTSAVTQPAPNALTPTRSATNVITLTPGRVVILAEKIKTIYLRHLGTTDQWGGQILLHLEPSGSVPVAPEMKRTLYRDGWQYRVTLPERLSAVDSIRVIVDALLEETAQRYSRQPVEIPLWLRVGMAEMIWASDGVSLTSSANVPVMFDTLHPDPLGEARTTLQLHKPYTFGDLCLPTRRQLAAEGWQIFRASAHLLTAELLLRPDGPAQLREFLRQLPRYRNSELAFLTAYKYENMLAVEQWWSVALTQFRSRDRFRRWSTKLSVQRIEEVLMIETPTDTKPQRAQIAIVQMKLGDQKQRLAQILFQLRSIKVNAPPSLIKLINDYHEALHAYYQQRGLDSLSPELAVQTVPEDAVARRLREQLDQLDTILIDISLLGDMDNSLGKTAPNNPPSAPSTGPKPPFPLPAGLLQLP